MMIIPAIDLRNGHCVRLIQGRSDAATVYNFDPVDVASEFERDGAMMLHVVDLDGAFAEANSTNRNVVREIVGRVKIPIQCGGGLRSVDDVDQLLKLGVTRVVIGTLAVESPETLRKLVREFGDRIVVGIDEKNGQALTHGWEQAARLSALDLAQRVADAGVQRIVYTDVNKDGMLNGLNVEETCRIARATSLKITASGGVSTLADIRHLVGAADCGIDSVIVGKALYEGRFTLRAAREEATHAMSLRP
jgi:phosphoribosylformimino-5-aminoimidazole carboxamide ribotide isomerase